MPFPAGVVTKAGLTLPKLGAGDAGIEIRNARLRINSCRLEGSSFVELSITNRLSS